MDKMDRRRPRIPSYWRVIVLLVVVPAVVLLSLYLVVPEQGLDRESAIGVLLLLAVLVRFFGLTRSTG